MPWKATTYVYSVIGLGTALLIEGSHRWDCPDWTRFLAYLAFALFAATLKVRLPGMPGTFSLSVFVVLVGMVDLTYPEAVFIATSSNLVQCLWRAERRPSGLQVLFNLANSTICVAVCSVVEQSLLQDIGRDNLPVQLALLATIFFPLNTLFVSGIIAILQHKDVATVWQMWFLWSFPYYLVGAALAGMAVETGRAYGWHSSLVLLPLMIFVYVYYKMFVGRHTARQDAA